MRFNSCLLHRVRCKQKVKVMRDEDKCTRTGQVAHKIYFTKKGNERGYRCCGGSFHPPRFPQHPGAAPEYRHSKSVSGLLPRRAQEDKAFSGPLCPQPRALPHGAWLTGDTMACLLQLWRPVLLTAPKREHEVWCLKGPVRGLEKNLKGD